MIKSINHLDATTSLILMTKFNITVDELDKITEIGFRFDEKSGCFVLEHDDTYSKDYLIIKAEGKEFKIENEEFLTEDDGTPYTDINKTTPYREQTLIQFLDMVYNNDMTFIKL